MRSLPQALPAAQIGGGCAGFYTAWKLEKKLRPGQARVTVIDPRPCMTYQPFLREVTAGSVEARHAAVSLRRHLRRTRLIAGAMARIEHAERTVTVAAKDRAPFPISYDTIVVTAGAVTRTFPIPGLIDQAIGMKQIEETVAIRDAPPAHEPPERSRPGGRPRAGSPARHHDRCPAARRSAC